MSTDIDFLNDMTWGYRASRVLQVANNLGIFNCLKDEHLNLGQICRACMTRPEATEKLLIACTAMGLIERQDNDYNNTELTKKYLLETSPLYQGDIITHASNVWDFWSGLENDIRLKNQPSSLRKKIAHSSFIKGMRNIAMAGRAELFLENIDLTGRCKLFDAGCGPGAYSILACKKYPDLKATVFDLPETIEITQQMIIDEEMQERIDVKEGSWETDDFDTNNDVVLFSNVLHGPDSEAAMKLGKAFDSMNPGGLLIVQEFLLNENKTAPLIPALFNVMVGAYSGGQLFKVIRKAGFKDPEIVATCDEIGSSWVTAVK